jgi:hypothetical protein
VTEAGALFEFITLVSTNVMRYTIDPTTSTDMSPYRSSAKYPSPFFLCALGACARLISSGLASASCGRVSKEHSSLRGSMTGLVTALAFVLALVSSTRARAGARGCESPGLPQPCLEVPRCGSQRHSPPAIVVDTQSSGAEGSFSHAESTEICYTETGLNLAFRLFNQSVTASLKSDYSTCNSAVYNLDVIEVFIAPTSVDPHCYSELDVSMRNTPFLAGIFNPSLNHSGISDTLLDCATTDVVHETVYAGVEQTQIWTASFKLPWGVIDKPAGCPESQVQVQPEGSIAGKVYRVNVFRIISMTDSVMDTQKCTADLCQYLAWSPNGVSPPSFHEPKFFGTLVLV